MKIRRLLNWLKMGCTVLVTLCILGTVGTLAYVHSTGLPEPLKNVLIKKLEEEKLYLSFDSLKYKLNQGIVAENAKVYKSAAKEKVLLSADEIKLNIDKTKLLRKVFELDSVIVDNGKVAMELAPDIPDASDLVIDGINGEFSISKNKKFESADGLSFHFEGIKIVIKGQAWETWETEDPEYPPATLEEQQAKIDQFENFRDSIRKIKWVSEEPPILTLTLNGDTNDLDKLELDFEASAQDLTYNGAKVENLNLKGSLYRQLVNLENLSFDYGKGKLSAQADLSLTVQKGTLSIDSTVDFKDIIRKVSGKAFAETIYFNGENQIIANGSFQLPTTNKDGQEVPLDLTLIGNAKFRNVSYLDAKLDYLASDFSWKKQSNSLFLNNLDAYSDENEFNGRLLLTPEQIKFSTTSTLPPKLFLPFLSELKIDKILNQTKVSDSTLCNISANGEIDRKNRAISNIEGSVYLANLSYRDTILKEASVDFKLNNSNASYTNANVTFDHSNWHKKKTFGGIETGYAKAAEINISKDPANGSRIVDLKGLEGEAWTAPVVRLFNPRAYEQFNKFNLEAPIKLNPSNLKFIINPPYFHNTGTVHIGSTVMSGIPMKDLSFDLDLKRGYNSIKNVEATLDYSNYYREKEQTKKTNGKISIKDISIGMDVDSTKDQRISLFGVEGEIWPGAVSAMFAKNAAKNIETLPFTKPIKSKNSQLAIIQDHKDWYTLLHLDLDSITYNDVTATDAKGIITIKNKETTFQNVDLTFDFSNYPKSKQYGGQKTGKSSVDLVTLEDGKTTFTNLKGLLWPGLVCSMFNQDVAKVIQNLDFTSPLTSTGSDMTIEYGDKNLTLGNLNLKDFSYNKTPINSLNLDLSVSDEEVDFSNITANLNVTNNPVRKEFGGSTENTIRANQVVMNLKSDLVKVDSLKGTFWPGSVVSLFLPSVAETLDEFRFRAPPSSNTSGTIDLADKSTRTSLSTTLSSGAFKYNFIDEDIPGISFSAAIKTTSEYCQLTNIKSELFEARAYKEPSNGSTVYPLSGKFTVYYNKEVPSFNGILAMNKLQISSIADTYDFEDLNEGTFSTLFHFEGDTSGAKKLNTTKETTFKIENANLVDIPLLGPFSKITKALGKTANNNRLGYSKISTANGAYTIKNGELNINNLRAASSSLELAGKGKYNIDTERVDMKFEVKGFNKGISFLEIIKPFIKNFPVIQGVMKYKAYGQLDDLKIRPDL